MQKSQRGQALVSVIAGVALVLGGLITALIVTQFSGKAVMRQLVYQGQALNAAQAGLTEGLSWFRRAPQQPVSNFAPLRDLTVTPNIVDTEDAGCNNTTNTACGGLVRTYQISAPGRVWARYELRRTAPRPGDVRCTSGAPPAANRVPAGCTYVDTNTLDITTQRGKRGTGVVWQLESEGAVFVRNRATVAYNVAPNVVLARRTMRSEIQRLAINSPTPAALVVSRGDAVRINNTDVRIQGTSRGGIAWVNTPGGAIPDGAGCAPCAAPVVTGAPATQAGIPISPDRFTIPYVFGLTDQELRGLANIEATSVAALPAALPDMNLIILNDPADQNKTYTFDSARPLTGTGILVVFGNLVIAPNSNSIYSGVIFVRGGYNQSAPSTINGTVIVDTNVARTVVLQGAGENSIIRYDQNLLDFVARRMGLYNESRSPYIPCRAGEICDE
jgi:hypothetical protein